MKNQLERIGALPSTPVGPQWQEAAASCHSSHLGLPPRAFPAVFGNHTGQAGGVRMDLRWHCHSKLRALVVLCERSRTPQAVPFHS